MLRVTVELLPHGMEANKRVLGVATITNDGTGNEAIGNYRATFSKWAPQQDKPWKTGRVEGFHRNLRGPWDLLFRALRSAVGDRNKEGT